MKKILFLFMLLALSSFSFGLDTLEVFAIRVEFKEEITDNSLTTGTGLFDSDKDTANANYSLDPSGRRASPAYWRKHFEFANAYFQSVSNGALTIEARIFPESGSSAYKLDKYIIDYNRTAKKKDEKTAEFDAARSQDYMNFIWDAVTAAHESDDSPFKIPQPTSPNRKRVYMIIHAGASRLVDGGSMGTNGADTQGDFMDVFIAPDSTWTYLDKTDERRAKDRNGMVLEGATIDTLKSIMVTSETASQDGLNWGVNGIMINQIGRAIGMPNTYDVVKGISRLGYYDVMDFAGYNAGNGFFPVLPSAWIRAYMGWANVTEVRPDADGKVKINLTAAGQKSGSEIIKVPLTSNEYLLIENRQRSSNNEGTVTVRLGSASDDSLYSELSLPIDSLHTVFLDSICSGTDNKCKLNKKKAKGIILSLSSFDAGLPASGIVVWKVNDWYLKEALPFGVVNFWGGDTLRDHQFGLAIVEADGILSIGKTFQNALGQATYDYGSGTDLLPHVRVGKNSPKDTVWSIDATGYGNTASTQGGFTGIKVTAAKASGARTERTSNAFMGDSVVNFAALSIPVTITWDDNQIDNAEFPRLVGKNAVPRNALFVNYPSGMTVGSGEKLMVFGGEDGTLQVLSARGDTLLASDTTILRNVVSSIKDSSVEVPLYRLGKPQGILLGLASYGSSIFSVHAKSGLVKTELLSDLDQVRFNSEKLALKGLRMGPMVTAAGVWVADSQFLYQVSLNKFPSRDSTPLPDNFLIQDMAVCGGSEGAENIALVGANAKIALYNGTTKTISSLTVNAKTAANIQSTQNQSFRVACADFDRDNNAEMFILGSRGYSAIIRANETATVVSAPRQYKRGGAFVSNDSSYTYDENAPVAIGDINGDGYPDAVFVGYNLLYAVDRSGVVLSGFPVTITRGIPEYGFLSDPLIVDVTGDATPEILIGTNGGLLMAFTSTGKQVTTGFPLSAGSFEYGDSISPMSIFVSNTIDSLSGPEVYAFHRDAVFGYRLPKASSNAALSARAWALPGSGNARTNYFDASLLGDPTEATETASIGEFFLYPNPIRGGKVNARFTLGMSAKSAVLEFFDITGLCVYSKKLGSLNKGSNQIDVMDVSQLGSDVYSVRLKVDFTSGKEKHKFYRVGLIR
ncbi:MAG: hypothetical protein WCX75_01705 [Fibrobacteraceae bacterium]